MFSCVVAGRLPLTAPQQVDETHAVFLLEDAQNINHITVFLTGQQPFPPGLSATVHFLWPGENQQWIMLGCLQNTKPSAIFRLRGSAIPSSATTSTDASSLFAGSTASTTFAPAAGGGGAPSVTATLGISIEADDLVDAQMAALQSHQGSGSDGGAASNALVLAKGAAAAGTRDSNAAVDVALALAPQIAKNAFSYLSSFAPDSASQTVPLLQKWLEQLERKLRSQGPEFLAKAD